MAYIRPLEITLAKKTTTELVLLFHKNITKTKLVFLWPNMDQRKLQSVKNKHTIPCIKVNLRNKLPTVEI